MTNLNLGWDRFLQEDDDVVALSEANTLPGLPIRSGTSTENKVSSVGVWEWGWVPTCLEPRVWSLLLLHRMIFVKDRERTGRR